MSVKWNSKIMFPTDSAYKARICGAEFGRSKSSGNPMITLTWEVVAPQEVEVAGELVNIAGVQCTQYYSTSTLDSDSESGLDDEKTKNNRKKTQELYTTLGIEDPIDFENPDTKVLLGKCAYVGMKSDVNERRKTPTIAQIETAKKAGKRPEGDLMTHPITGAKLVDYWPKITDVFGLCAEDSVAAAY
jgi:hypothetical protein